MVVGVMLFFLLFHFANAKNATQDVNKGGYIAILENNLENLFSDYAVYIAKWLESFNDAKFKNSEVGKFLRYEDIKPKLKIEDIQGRSMKKMSMMMMPLIFHMGVAATWVMLTGLMAAKSVGIGLILLIFKIAVSSAKVASFFTLLKAKHSDHHEWSWSPPHHEHHGYYRSLLQDDTP